LTSRRRGREDRAAIASRPESTGWGSGSLGGRISRIEVPVLRVIIGMPLKRLPI
jgi:hypothetical protein